MHRARGSDGAAAIYARGSPGAAAAVLCPLTTAATVGAPAAGPIAELGHAHHAAQHHP